MRREQVESSPMATDALNVTLLQEQAEHCHPPERPTQPNDLIDVFASLGFVK